MSKYKKQFTTMLEENSELFSQFKVLHEKIVAGDESVREEFNALGQKVLRVIRRYENALCAKSENSGFGKFSSNLSDMFWGEVRAYIPRIDEVPLE